MNSADDTDFVPPLPEFADQPFRGYSSTVGIVVGVNGYDYFHLPEY